MLDKTCVHIFSQNDHHLVVDGNSGAVHVVDEIASEVIQTILDTEKISTIDHILTYFSNPDLQQVVAEVVELIQAGLLFSADITEIPPRQESVVKALCLNVAHDCNLRCEYCFASTGDFGGERELMSLDVAKAAVDFLIAGSGNRRQLEIDFFGGEPLMNWDVVKSTVLYGNEQAAKHGKIFRFTITTNGIGLTQEITEFINEHMYNVVLSIDGRPEVNDRVRQTVSQKGSVHDIIVPRFKNLVDTRNGKSYYVRGTFTRHNLDFSEDVLHLGNLGFEQISMEPVVANEAEPYAFKMADFPEIATEYEKLAELYLEQLKGDKAFEFFHFNVELKKGPCLYKRLSGCGAGYEYLAVAPSGEIYPCHQFVGQEEFILGTVSTGIENQELPNKFKDSHVLNKPVCSDCWAKYYCSGGCHKNNLEFAGSLLDPYELSCMMEKKRLECAFYIQASLA